jgi:hypothetical protein
LLPRKRPHGLFDRYLQDLQTPLGLSLSIEAHYDASVDNGRLVITSGETSLAEVSPFSRGFQMISRLPTGEELCVTASADD